MLDKTAMQWRNGNTGKEENIRDYSPLEQLLVLANKSLKAEFIHMHFLNWSLSIKFNHTVILQIK